jgi:hypothetical protein
MNKEDEERLKRYEQQAEKDRSVERSKAAIPYATAMFEQNQKQNLVEWQLDFKYELEDIERFLRCDLLSRDGDGNEIWIKNPNQENVFLNELGVSDIIREIRMFLNKNKVLSNYGIEDIKPRINIIAHELRMLIYNNYEKYGIDNEYKMNNYPIIIVTLMAMIEDAYRRSINGEERKDLNQARVVNQNEPIGYSPQYSSSNQTKKNSIFPWKW